MGIGDLVSAGRLSKGMEVITPAVIDSAAGSMSLEKSMDWTEDRLEWREEREPGALPGGARVSKPVWASWRSSTGFSLCNFLPKNDFPAEVCLDLSGADVVVGILTDVAGEMQGAA